MCKPSTTHRVLLVALMSLVAAAPLEAGTRIKDISRVKGQESNTLRGLGIVVGLSGTGDGGNYLPMIRSLATAMTLMGNRTGRGGPVELKETKNVALVAVTVTIPPGGARQGDQLDCFVSSIGMAKSLAGGELFMTPLQGPHVESDRVFGFAQGPVHLDDAKFLTRGRVTKGCRLEEDMIAAYTKDDSLTLILDEHHADFELAQEIAELINNQFSVQSTEGMLAKAQDQVNITVKIPPQYRADPISFISQVQSLTVEDPPAEARVVINEAAGSIVIGSDVGIGPAIITHRNVVIETGEPIAGANRFVPIDPASSQGAKLRSLVEALNAVRLPSADIIEVIKGLNRNGKLYGKLIVE